MTGKNWFVILMAELPYSRCLVLSLLESDAYAKFAKIKYSKKNECLYVKVGW